MCKRLISYLEVNKVLGPFQFGFRSIGLQQQTGCCSTLTTHMNLSKMDIGQYLLMLFLDFSQAFDTVNHRILLNKLHHVGVRGVSQRWFESHITH